MTAIPAIGAGEWMLELAAALFPICRSITGAGVRETLRIVGRQIDLEVHEVPSGTRVLDWIVPDEWNIRDAYIADASGTRIVDFNASNLHVVGYSEPVNATLGLDELRPHLFMHPTEPEWIPYRTSYYERSWGFCVTRSQLELLERGGPYEVVIDSTLEPGFLTYGECVLPGELEDEVLLSTHICHPSLANENLSGISVLAALGAALADRPHRLTYRLLFIPGTIGSITWLARNDQAVSRVVAGLVVACVGDPAPLSYKRSRFGSHHIDRAAEHVIQRLGGNAADFVPWGWDERQFNSPGFDLPVGRLARSGEGEYPEYHSSADSLDLIDEGRLAGALQALEAIVQVLEEDRVFLNLEPRGEPHLGRRGLYSGLGGGGATADALAMLWVLNQADGTQSLLDTAIRSGIPFSELSFAAERLVGAGLLEPREWAIS